MSRRFLYARIYAYPLVITQSSYLPRHSLYDRLFRLFLVRSVFLFFVQFLTRFENRRNKRPGGNRITVRALSYVRSPWRVPIFSAVRPTLATRSVLVRP